MDAFWIVGIAINVVFFGVAVWWVLRNMRAPGKDASDKNEH